MYKPGYLKHCIKVILSQSSILGKIISIRIFKRSFFFFEAFTNFNLKRPESKSQLSRNGTNILVENVLLALWKKSHW